MATHTIFLLLHKYYSQKLWLSRKNVIVWKQDQVGMPKINISFKWKWDEKEQRQEGKLLCSYINMYKTEFQMTWSRFCRSIDHESRLWGYDWLWGSIILYSSSGVLATLLHIYIIHVRNLFVLDYSKSHASSKFIPYFSEENRWETEQSYYNVSKITQFFK